MKKIIYLVLLCVGTFCGAVFYVKKHDDLADMQEKSLLIVVPSYNNKDWYVRNLDSIFSQEYGNYHVVYIDDCSPDGTGQLVADYIEQRGLHSKITLVKNEVNKGALYNIYHAIHGHADDNDVVLTVDGDDWLAHNHVFKRVNEAYQNPNVWMTYGQYRHYPDGRLGICREQQNAVVRHNAYRRAEWHSSHLRTFYAWLFKRIEKKDMMHNGQLVRVTWDMAFMFPMLEMSGGRYQFIPDVLYVYNCATPLNDYKVRLREQLAMNQLIRSKVPYDPIEHIITV